MAYPTTLVDLDTTRGTASQTLAVPSHVTHHTAEDAVIEALQTKVGIDSSADTSSIDYKLKSVSSINPGHKHTLLAGISDVAITTPTDGNGLFYDEASSTWKNSSTNVADASTTVKGVTKMSVAPADSASPIAVGDNDGRVPTQDENNALVGNNTGIAVGTGNKYVTQTGFQAGAEVYGADAEANDTYVITLSPVPASLPTGIIISFKANTANTGASTLNVNSLGAKTIKKLKDQDLEDGDIKAGQIATVIYDGTNFQMQSAVGKIATIITTASDTLALSADTERTHTGNTNYTKKKSIRVNYSGSVRIKYDIKTSGSAYEADAKIYNNGVVIAGPTPTNSEAYATVSADFQVGAGDILDLYIMITTAAQTVSCRNFRIYYDKTTTTSDGSIITD